MIYYVNVMLTFQLFDCLSIMLAWLQLLSFILYALAGPVQSTESSNHLQIAHVRRDYLLTNSLGLVATRILVQVARLQT